MMGQPVLSDIEVKLPALRAAGLASNGMTLLEANTTALIKERGISLVSLAVHVRVCFIF